MNKKCGISVLVVISLCVILGVLLGVLLPRRESDNDNYDSVPPLPQSSPWFGNEDIRLYREYLRIPSVHPDIDYGPCVEFLKRQANNLDLPVSVYYPANDKNPVVVITWLGSEPELQSIMLNSHMDVVPTFDEFWSHKPFDADVDEIGRIIARGAQDSKVIGMTQLAAIGAIKREGIQQLKRTFHVTFVPDEEQGGYLGMKPFVTSAEFKSMNVGYAFDEGRVSLTNNIIVNHEERCPWRIEFVAHGITGHGSILFENTTGEKISYLISKMLERRQIEVDKLNAANQDYTNVTTINLTVMNGGVQGNVIPPDLSVIFDVRLAVNADHDEFERQLDQWCEEAGGNITINYLMKEPKSPGTPADETNPAWVALYNATKELGLEITPQTTIGASDARYLRREGVHSFGFSPIKNTPMRGHDHDEYVHAEEFLAGINYYKKVILKLGDI